MENNYLVQKRRNEQKKYRRKVTMVVTATVLGLLLIMIGLKKLQKINCINLINKI